MKHISEILEPRKREVELLQLLHEAYKLLEPYETEEIEAWRERAEKINRELENI